MQQYTENSKCIKAYRNADKTIRQKVDRRIKNYLKDPDTSLVKLGEQLTDLLPYTYSKKVMSSFLLYMGYPKKDKALTTIRKNVNLDTYKTKRENYSQEALAKYCVNSGKTKDDFVDDWQSYSFLTFENKYSISQHEVEAIAEYLGVTDKKAKQYTYEDLYNDLINNGVTKEDLFDMYLVHMLPQSKIVENFESLLGRKIGDKRITKLFTVKLGYKRTDDQVRRQKGLKSRREYAANMKHLSEVGYTIGQLANEYENDHSMTKSRLVEDLNSKLGESDDGFKFTERWFGRYLDPLLTDVRKGNVSREELNFRKYFLQRFPEFTNMLDYNRRDIISPQELDIYIPSKRVAIEFNGDFWHSDKYMTINHDMTAREYHESKQTECAKHNIQLFFVWETDWNERHEEVLDAFQEYFNSGNILPIISTIDK